MRSVFTVIIASLIPISALGQTITDGWKGIKAFASTRADVEQALGQVGKETEAFRFTFETDEATVRVLFFRRAL